MFSERAVCRTGNQLTTGHGRVTGTRDPEYDPATDPRPFTSLFWASQARVGPPTPLGGRLSGNRTLWRPPHDPAADSGPATNLGSATGGDADRADDLLGPGLVTGHVLGLFAALGRGDRFDPILWGDGSLSEEVDGSGAALSGEGDTQVEQDQSVSAAAAESRAEQIEDGFLQWSDLHESFAASFAGSGPQQQSQGGFPAPHPPSSSSSSISSSSGEGQEGGAAAVSAGEQQGPADGPGGPDTGSSRLEQRPEVEYISGATADIGPGQTGTQAIYLEIEMFRVP